MKNQAFYITATIRETYVIYKINIAQTDGPLCTYCSFIYAYFEHTSALHKPVGRRFCRVGSTALFAQTTQLAHSSVKTMAYMAWPPIGRVLAAIFDTIFVYFALLLCHLWVDILCQGLNYKSYFLFQPYRQKTFDTKT